MNETVNQQSYNLLQNCGCIMPRLLYLVLLCKSKSGIIYEILSAHLLLIFKHQTNQHIMMSFLPSKNMRRTGACITVLKKYKLAVVSFLLPPSITLAHLWRPSMAGASYPLFSPEFTQCPWGKKQTA